MKGTFKCRRCVNDAVSCVTKSGLNGGVERVESFVYLGDTLNAGGGCLNAVTARVRVGWMKFKGLSEILCGKKWSLLMKGRVNRACVRAAMIYGGEIWLMRREDEGVLQRAERAMVRLMCEIKWRERKSSKELMMMMGLEENIVTVVRRSRLRWYGHVLRRDEEVGIRKVLNFEVNGVAVRGRPHLGWTEQVENDRVKAGLRDVDAGDRCTWRKGISTFHHR